MKKRILGIGLALAVVAGIITTGFVLADSPKSTDGLHSWSGMRIDPVKWEGTVDGEKVQNESGCGCSFVVLDSEPPVPDTNVQSVDPATGEVKYGFQTKITKVQVIDCPCTQNYEEMFPSCEVIPPTATP